MAEYHIALKAEAENLDAKTYFRATRAEIFDGLESEIKKKFPNNEKVLGFN